MELATQMRLLFMIGVLALGALALLVGWLGARLVERRAARRRGLGRPAPGPRAAAGGGERLARTMRVTHARWRLLC